MEGFAEELARGFYTVAKRKSDDIFSFSDRLKRMKQEAKNLENVRAKVQDTIDRYITSTPVPRVYTWLTEIEEIQVKMKEIVDKILNTESGILSKIKSGFSHGEEVKLITQQMENLQKKGRGFNSGNMFLPLPAPAMLPFIQLGNTHEFKSRKNIEDGIVEVLSRGEVKIVGICGMGGAGKTTLAEKIMSRVQKQGLFPAVMKVVVWRPLDKWYIQQQIIDSLGFNKQERKVVDIKLRARLLSSKLQGPEKVLILVDDVWATFSLEELGIPREGGCATLITSRDLTVLKKMCDYVFEIGTLPQDEALCLFEDKAGIQFNDPNYRPMAEQILQECDGLPLAIAAIGSALKNKMKQDWERALRALKHFKPIKEAEDVHASVRVSYESLDGEEDARLLLLLCSLFPEDYCIRISDLELYMMGLKMLNEVDSLVKARDRVWYGVDKLKSCYLLSEGKNNTEVKMHAVVRHVAISISKKEGLRPKGQYDRESKWISEFTTTNNEPLNHLIGTNFSNIRLLIIHNLFWRDEILNIDGISILKGMQGLNVVSYKNVGFQSPPEEIEWPKKLLTLQLERNMNLKTLSFVGDLLNLKILDCCGCEGIEELPVEIARLNGLKLLNLSGCKKLQRIAPGVIKQLVELEELKMLNSFNKWESSKVNDKEGMNVPLNELEALRKLTCLEIDIKDKSLVDEKMEISWNLIKYRIRFDAPSQYGNWIYNYEKTIFMCRLPNEITNNGSWIHKLLDTSGVEGLALNGDGGGNWANLSVTHHTLKRLEIRGYNMLQELINSSSISVDTSRSKFGATISFPMLEHLELDGLPNLKQICSGQITEGSISYSYLTKLLLFNLPSLEHTLKSAPNQQVPFSILREVKVWRCGKLLNVFLLGRTKDAFIQLETLTIEECETMEHVFISRECDENGKTTFAKLKKLQLKSLRSLTTFWKGRERIEFPSLEELTISGCVKMKSMVSSGMESESEHHYENDQGTHQTSPFFCARKVTFGRLKRFTLESNNNIWRPQSHESCFRSLEWLKIKNCHKTISLFSPSMVKDLVNLNYLRIQNCDALEELIRNEKNNEGMTCQITFPKLETLQLAGLQSLQSIATGIQITFPKLKRLDLVGLQSLQSIATGIESIEFPMLENLNIKFCRKLQIFVSLMEYSEESGQECNYDEEAFYFFCDKKVPGSFFGALNTINIYQCHNVTSLLSPPMVTYLVNLNYLCIMYCDAMEEVLRNEKHKDEGNTCPVIFPKLNGLILIGLGTLTSITKGIESIEFPMLEYLIIVACPKLKRTVSVTEYNGESVQGSNKDNDDDEGLYALFDDKVKFNKLKHLEISYCDGLSRLFTSSVAGNLTTLTHILIDRCHQIKAIICENETCENNILFPSLEVLEISNMDLIILFPNLEVLEISNMDLMEMLCEWKCPLEFSMLEDMRIFECPNLKFLTNGSLSTPKLKKMMLDGNIYVEEEWKVVEDLNKFVSQHVTATKKSQKSTSTWAEDISGIPSSSRVWPTKNIWAEDISGITSSSHGLPTDVSASAEESTKTEDCSSTSQGLLSIDTVTGAGKTDMEKSNEVDAEEPLGKVLESEGYMRDCFQYCSLFPAEYEFSRDTLIWSWIAAGLINFECSDEAERAAVGFFDRLIRSNYILQSGYDHMSDQMKYKVDNDNSPLKIQPSEIPYRKMVDIGTGGVGVEHLSLMFEQIDSIESIRKCTHLKTLLLHKSRAPKFHNLLHALFLELKFLTNLDLSGTNIEELPSSIDKLKALKFLDMSETPITRLPASIGSLDCLETLLLRRCLSLCGLPKCMWRLVKLKHLVVDLSKLLQSMPIRIGKLTNLQTLGAFVIGRKDGSGIRELENMNKLKGSLCLMKLDNIPDAKEAAAARLCNKKYLSKLEFIWGDLKDGKVEMAEEILENLRPHFGLQELIIVSYSGGKLPSWISNPSFNHMDSITLHGCRCKKLPPLGVLPSLKSLKIVDMDKLGFIDKSFCQEQANPDQQPFPKLETLYLEGMSNLETWTGVEDDHFPCLQQLSIKYCQKLKALPNLSCLISLQDLEIRYSPKLSCLPEGGLPTSLQSLMLSGCPDLQNRCCNEKGEKGEDWTKVAGVPTLYIEHQKIEANAH